MVPDEGFEPPTFGLQNRCSTTELIRHKYLIYLNVLAFANTDFSYRLAIVVATISQTSPRSFQGQ